MCGSNSYKTDFICPEVFLTIANYVGIYLGKFYIQYHCNGDLAPLQLAKDSVKVDIWLSIN